MNTDKELMQQALEALEAAEVTGNCSYGVTELLRTRLAQPEQDVSEASCGNMGPVGWLESPDGVFRENPLYKIKFPSSLLSWQVPLYTALPEQEPVGVVHHKLTSTLGADYEQVAVFVCPLEPGTKLYTTPPQRKPLQFAGLSITEIRLPVGMTSLFENGVLIIEAAHGIKEKA